MISTMVMMSYNKGEIINKLQKKECESLLVEISHS